MDNQAKRGAAYEWGMEAEQIAADYLLARGYVIRERRWRCGASKKEIDIIAEKDAVMVFVEVKARTCADTDPAEAVDARKIRFLTQAADNYLAELPYDYSYRFDIIGITGTAVQHGIEHIEDAFLPPLTTR